ncbi:MULTISPECIES: hypothetical protein [Lysobacter]|uniref:Uncharacterized protein n=1 Tax=Lysobacter firmicutimachus TaxID=1792846 RepID=A0ABU8DAW3_9GAMM|nr:hypothetical protein [Lysobacter antibioticus]
MSARGFASEAIVGHLGFYGVTLELPTVFARTRRALAGLDAIAAAALRPGARTKRSGRATPGAASDASVRTRSARRAVDRAPRLQPKLA